MAATLENRAWASCRPESPRPLLDPLAARPEGSSLFGFSGHDPDPRPWSVRSIPPAIPALALEVPPSSLRPIGAGRFYMAGAGVYQTISKMPSKSLLAAIPEKRRTAIPQPVWIEPGTQLCKDFDNAHHLYNNEGGDAYLTEVRFSLVEATPVRMKMVFVKYTCSLCFRTVRGHTMPKEASNGHLSGKDHEKKLQSANRGRLLSRANEADTNAADTLLPGDRAVHAPSVRLAPGFVLGTCGTPSIRTPPGLTEQTSTRVRISNRRLRPADLLK